MTPSLGEQGFSLIETLVALAVIAGMTGLLFETITVNARFAHDVSRRREATLVAQSLLAQASIPAGMGEPTMDRRLPGLTWRTTRQSARGGARDSSAPLEDVRIDVIDQSDGRRLVSVRTLRLAR